MNSEQINLLQGTLGLLFLKALNAGELHGLGISRRIEQITRGTFIVKPGSLFPALHRGDCRIAGRFGIADSNSCSPANSATGI